MAPSASAGREVSRKIADRDPNYARDHSLVEGHLAPGYAQELINMESPDMNLGNFLVRLAVDDNLRASFELAPKATLDGLSPHLSPEVEDAILDRRRNTLPDVLNIANESSDPWPPWPWKKTKKATK